jgi:putative selenate reductase
MRPIPLKDLITVALGEYRQTRSIFGIPQQAFFVPKGDSVKQVFSEQTTAPIGPAAGPHTQLAQNILCGYLTGGRFFELKTVQILDSLELEKPCIDAKDEAYNVEWSTELSLDQAFDEYLKAWFLLYLFSELLGLSSMDGRDFIFNMSVGYDLAGIQNPRVDRFIESMKDASEDPRFGDYQGLVGGTLGGCPPF